LSGKRILAAAGAIAVLGAATGVTAAYRSVAPYGEIGNRYVAKQICSCVFVAGRSEGSCRKEFEPDITRFDVKISHGPGNTSGEVRTRLALFEGHAVFDPRYGCSIPD
jgi:hypothetical protein